jgi:hypothetical protein
VLDRQGMTKDEPKTMQKSARPTCAVKNECQRAGNTVLRSPFTAFSTSMCFGSREFREAQRVLTQWYLLLRRSYVTDTYDGAGWAQKIEARNKTSRKQKAVKKGLTICL